MLTHSSPCTYNTIVRGDDVYDHSHSISLDACIIDFLADVHFTQTQALSQSCVFLLTFCGLLFCSYGDSFSEASAKTSQLFETRGFTLLVNDDLTGLPLFFGGVSVGALCSLGSVVWSSFYMGHEKTVLIGYALTAFVIGILMASIAFGVITSAVSTTFVVWAESPQEMSLQQPQSFKLISEARRSYYGNN